MEILIVALIILVIILSFYLFCVHCVSVKVYTCKPTPCTEPVYDARLLELEKLYARPNTLGQNGENVDVLNILYTDAMGIDTPTAAPDGITYYDASNTEYYYDDPAKFVHMEVLC